MILYDEIKPGQAYKDILHLSQNLFFIHDTILHDRPK